MVADAVKKGHPYFNMVVDRNVGIPMRDGTVLAADVYRPNAPERFPTLLQRTPYDKSSATQNNYASPSWYAARGFAVVVQDVRGRWSSDGVFDPFEAGHHDGYDSVTWTAAQPWSNGRVGMYGFSYCGVTQMRAAASLPPALHAIAPAMTGSCYGEGWTFHGGTLALSFALGWSASLAYDQAVRAGDDAAAGQLDQLRTDVAGSCRRLPLRRGIPEALRKYAPYLEEWLRRPPAHPFWEQTAPRSHYKRAKLPALHIAGWYDTFLEGTIENYAGMKAAGSPSQELVIGPWVHIPWSRYTGQLDFGPSAEDVIDEMQVDFFSRHLHPPAAMDAMEAEPAVRYFIMGANRWEKADRWPPPVRQPLVLFLASDGRAGSGGTGALSTRPASIAPTDSFVSNPHSPVPSLGGRGIGDPALMGPVDQRPVEARHDVLVYSSKPLSSELLVTGSPLVVLHIAIDTPSADLVARLAIVDETGRSIPVSDAVRRLSRGETECGKTVTLRFSPVAVLLAARQRIRLTIAGSDFPARERNPNDGRDPLDATWSSFRPAMVTVLHTETLASRLELPLAAATAAFN